MKAVVQRVTHSQVQVEGETVGAIGAGLMVLLGVGREDTQVQVDWLADKIVNLRIFEDDGGKMNRSLLEVGGEMLVVSQFTLLGDCRKGRRPSFVAAAPPESYTTSQSSAASDVYKRQALGHAGHEGLVEPIGHFGRGGRHEGGAAPLAAVAQEGELGNHQHLTARIEEGAVHTPPLVLSLIHISEPTRPKR